MTRLQNWRRPEVVAVAIALVPVLLAVIRHSTGEWLPIGDNALIEIRSRDVQSLRHMPLLGTWSSASLSAGTDLNHPGPILFDLLALPVAIFGGPIGIAAGVGMINAAAIVGIARVGFRIAGQRGALLATSASALLSYAMGSGMLVDAWNPHVTMLPALALFMLTLAVASGDLRMFPWLLVVGSFCVQVHLGYAYLVPSVTLIALGGWLTVSVRRWTRDNQTRLVDAAEVKRVIRWSAVGLGAIWLQPIIEQLFGQGEGNLSRIVGNAGGEQVAVGPRLATKVIASVVALPPWFGRSSIVDAVPITKFDAEGLIRPIGMPGLGAAVTGTFVVVTIICVAALVAFRRRDRVGFVGAVVAAVGLIVVFVSIAIMPVGPIALTPHQMRWLWPFAVFIAFVFALALLPLGRLDKPTHGSAQRSAWMLATLVVVISAMNVPRFDQPVGPDVDPAAIPVAHELSDELKHFRHRGQLLFDDTDIRPFEGYSAVMMSALIDVGVDLRVTNPGLVRQLGNARRLTDADADVVYILEGRAALVVPSGSNRIAFSTPLTSANIERLLVDEQAMVDVFVESGVVFSEPGNAMIDANAFGMTRTSLEAVAADPALFVGSGLAAEMIVAGALELGDQSELLTAVAVLRRTVDITTVAVLVRPG